MLKIKKDYILKFLEDSNEEMISKLFNKCVELEKLENIKDCNKKYEDVAYVKPIWFVNYNNLPTYTDKINETEYLEYKITC